MQRFALGVFLTLFLSGCVQTVMQPSEFSNSAFAVHDVFFATTRNDTGKENLNTRFGKKRAPITYGINQVGIPANYPKAHSASFVHWNISLKRNPEKHVALINTNTTSNAAFFEQLRLAAARSPNEPILLFIHGFNTPFERAARIAAKLNYDLGLQTPSVLFSWPSLERPSAYPADEENLAWSQRHIEGFLADVFTALPEHRFVLLAHSMGSRALVKTLQSDFGQLETFQSQIANVVLAAPDIDAEIFVRDIAPNLIELNVPISLYASNKDLALKASNQLHGYDRAGYAGDAIVVVEGIDTIDASDAESELLGHEYFSQGAHTVNDMYQWIVQGKAPADRENLTPVEHSSGVYWKLITE